MTTLMPVQVQVRKEVRGLLPWWTAIAVAIVACTLLARQEIAPPLLNEKIFLAGLIAYAAGAVTLGALSIGHEFSVRRAA